MAESIILALQGFVLCYGSCLSSSLVLMLGAAYFTNLSASDPVAAFDFSVEVAVIAAALGSLFWMAVPMATRRLTRNKGHALLAGIVGGLLNTVSYFPFLHHALGSAG